jgi:UDP-3-O-[3-hydroxymyristoyl] glucosamine N-acyltransferase
VRIQAQSGIGRNIKDNETIQGSPAFNYGDFSKSYVHFKNLPKIMNRFNSLEKKLKEE